MTVLTRLPNVRRVSVGSLARYASALFLLAGAATLAYVSYVFVSARHFQTIETNRLQNSDSSLQPRLVAEGDVVGEINVPRIGLSAIVVQGDSDDVLRHAVGHVPETALPGQSGNIALAGHRDTLFRPLRDIQMGDTITLKTAVGNHAYRVDSTEVVPPTRVEVLESREFNELTLITCFPFHYIGHAPNRFIVHAREIRE